MYDMLVTTPLLVVGAGAADTITKFTADGIGAIIAGAMGIAGFLILLFAVFKAVKDILGGKIGGAIKSIAGGAVIAAFLLFPDVTMGGLIDLAQTVIKSFTTSAEGGKLEELGGL